MLSKENIHSSLKDGKYFACPRERARAESRMRYQTLLVEKHEAEMAGRAFEQEESLRAAAAEIAAADAVPRKVECGMPKCSKKIDLDRHEYVTFPVPFAKHRRGQERVASWHFGGETHPFEKVVCVPCWERFHAEVEGRACPEPED
jgi:hypothetical protein